MGASCGSGVKDIEDLSGPLRTSACGSRGLVPQEDEQWLERLRAETGVKPLYRAQDIRVVHLELTTRCNAACPQCARNEQGGQENPLLRDHHAELSAADVQRLLPPRLLRRLKKVLICGNFGDPGVAKECLEVLKYLCSVRGGARVGLFTNGGMRSPEWWAELGRAMQPAERAFVRFAIDGDESTNHLYRQHVDWGRLMANVRAFLDAGGNAEWDFIVFEHNEHQVEQVRALAEQMGFTRFSAKKTSRFLDRKRGVVREFTPVRDGSGDVVRQLRPPRDPQWQNTAAVRDAQETLAAHGTMEAYYDACEVKCKAAVDRELYISAEGLAFPCCWIAQDLYSAGLKDADRQIVRLLGAADPLRGIRSQSVLGREGIEGVVNRKRGLFDHLVHAAARQPSVAAGRLGTCARVCGTGVRAFAGQFEGARQQLDPALRAPPAAAAAAREPEAKVCAAAPLLIWYGSETGNAERLARRAAAVFGAAAEVSSPPPPGGFARALEGRRALLLVLATWDDGEPTTDAQALFSWLGGAPPGPGPSPAALPVAVYGVGSSLWPRFNAAARRARGLLAAAGAQELAAPGEGDAAAGELDGPFLRWLRGAVAPALGAIGVAPQAGPPSAPVCAAPPHAGPVAMTLRSRRRLAPGDPEALYCELELEGPLAWRAADAVGVLPPDGGGTGAEGRPRWYTASSAPPAAGGPRGVRLTVREVPGGAVSPWLCRLAEGDTVRCLPPRRASPLAAAWEVAAAAAAGASQRQPADGVRRWPPLLLVANGAGVAPFVALLELLERSPGSAAGRPECRMWLGARRRGAVPHGDRLEAFAASSALAALRVAESRPLGAGPAQYVQEAVADDACTVGDALYPRAGPPGVMLVCGSAAMGSAMRSVLSSIASRRGGSVASLEADRRLVFELW